jgi:UDPglucose 6-dehydrogenase
MKKIGVIGVGVVGTAVMCAMNKLYPVGAYDPPQGLKDFSDVLDCDVVFVCVPTPTIAGTWEQDATILRNTLTALASDGYTGVVAIKSTTLPGTCEQLKAEFEELRIVHNPEFLTAARPYADFMDQKVVIVGGPRRDAQVVGGLYQQLLETARIEYLDTTTHSELAKYMHNCFLAVKVGFCNEMSELSKMFGADYAEVRYAALSQGGIGDGHTCVPGPDGKVGFGGACFPKDTKALYRLGRMLGVEMDVLGAAVMGNILRRGE